jgi:hypothetical protein
MVEGATGRGIEEIHIVGIAIRSGEWPAARRLTTEDKTYEGVEDKTNDGKRVRPANGTGSTCLNRRLP